MFDLIFFVILLLCFLKGFFSRIKAETVNLVSLGLGVFLGIAYHREYSLIINQYLERPSLSKVLTFVAILILASLVGSLLNLIMGLSSIESPNVFERTFSGTLSGIKGLIICFCVYVIVSDYLVIFAEDLNHSIFSPYFSKTLQVILSFG